MSVNRGNCAGSLSLGSGGGATPVTGCVGGAHRPGTQRLRILELQPGNALHTRTHGGSLTA